jgi:hypothetical protein
MNKLDSALLELLNMFITTEEALKKEKDQVLLVQSFRMFKKKDKKNNGIVSKSNKPTEGIKKDKGMCHRCGNEGHWRRNCMEYLATMKAKKLNEAYTSGMFIIANYLTNLLCSSWVLNIECGFHIYNYMQELKKITRLVEGKVDQ